MQKLLAVLVLTLATLSGVAAQQTIELPQQKDENAKRIVDDPIIASKGLTPEEQAAVRSVLQGFDLWPSYGGLARLDPEFDKSIAGMAAPADTVPQRVVIPTIDEIPTIN